MASRAVLDPQFSQRVQEVFGLKTPPLTKGDLEAALSERWTARVVKAEALFAPGKTRHEIEFGGRVKHTHCALDALMVPFLTGQRISLRSQCPHCEETVTIQATPSSYRSSHPEAVISFGVSREGAGTVRQNACPFINLFPSKGHYKMWAAETRDALTVPLGLSEAFTLLAGPACC